MNAPELPHFSDFREACQDAGFTAVDCGRGHWRIVGSLVMVNWYPFSKKRTIYVNGTTASTSATGGIREAIQAAEGHLPTMQVGSTPTKRKGATWARRVKDQWFKRGKVVCHVCRRELTRNTCTIDHNIPLTRGGSNLPDNRRPACEGCNQDKGHKLGVDKSALKG